MVTIITTSRMFFFFTALLFVIAPFYVQPNIGGQGLNATFNISTWMVGIFIIGVASLFISQCRRIYYPSNSLYITLFLLVLILASYMAGIEQPIDWLFRVLYIIGGIFFLLALFQYQIKQKQIEQVLYLILLSMLFHAVISICQVNANTFLENYFPLFESPRPGGVFRQVNLQATYLVTGVTIALFLISRPSFGKSNYLLKAIVIFFIACAVYVVVLSGSRLGLLTLILSTSLVLISRRQQLVKRRKLIAALLVVSVVSAFLAQAGFDKAIDKTARVTESITQEEYKSTRLTMYAISAELIKDKPFWGHGVGSFFRVWSKETAQFGKGNPNAKLERLTLSHPHNEFLFWLIEGGLFAVIAILIGLAVVAVGLYRCGFKRGGAYAAMLLPISLHTQLELPFYVSSLHWFMWLFLVFIVLRHNSTYSKVRTSQAAIKSLQIFTLVFVLGISYFLVNTARAQADIYKFLYDKNSKPPYLKVALNNIYYSELAEELAFKAALYSDIKNNNQDGISRFIMWAENAQKIKPKLIVYTDLIKAYRALGMNEKACSITSYTLIIYPNQPTLNKEQQQCEKL